MMYKSHTLNLLIINGFAEIFGKIVSLTTFQGVRTNFCISMSVFPITKLIKIPQSDKINSDNSESQNLLLG